MFGAKYSRMFFWIWSGVLLIPTSIAMQMDKVSDSGTPAILIFIFTFIWINVLANRIRDFGGNPWLALTAILPFVNLVFTLYYGIKQHSNEKQKLQNAINKAVENGNTEEAKELMEFLDKPIKELQADLNQEIQNGNEIKAQQLSKILNLMKD